MVVAYVLLILILSGVALHAEKTDVSTGNTKVPLEHSLNGDVTLSPSGTADTYTNDSHKNLSASPKSGETTLEIPGSSTFSSEATSQPANSEQTTSASTSQELEITSSTAPVNTSQEPEVISSATAVVNTSQESQVTSSATVFANTSQESQVTSSAAASVTTSQESQVTSSATVPVNTSREPQVPSNLPVTQHPHSTAMDILNNTRTTAESRTTAKVSNVTNITEPEEDTRANVTTSFQSTEFLTKESGPFTTDAPTTRDMSTSTSEKRERRPYTRSAVIATVISVVVFLIGLVGMGLWFYNVRYRLHQRDRPILRDAEVNDPDSSPFSVVYYQNDGNEEVMLQKH